MDSYAQPEETHRTCFKCGCDRPIEDYKPVKRTWFLKKTGEMRVRRYRLRYCVYCQRKADNAHRAQNPEAARARSTKHRRLQPDKDKAARRRYDDSEKGKARRARYSASARGREVQAAYRKRKRERIEQQQVQEQELLHQQQERKQLERQQVKEQRRAEKEELRRFRTAFPVEVLAPYAGRILADCQANGHNVEWAVGVDASKLAKIRDCKQSVVGVATVDKMTMHCDTAMDTIMAETEEWAVLHGVRWPEDYPIR